MVKQEVFLSSGFTVYRQNYSVPNKTIVPITFNIEVRTCLKLVFLEPVAVSPFTLLLCF